MSNFTLQSNENLRSQSNSQQLDGKRVGEFALGHVLVDTERGSGTRREAVGLGDDATVQMFDLLESFTVAAAHSCRCLGSLRFTVDCILCSNSIYWSASSEKLLRKQSGSYSAWCLRRLAVFSRMSRDFW